MKPLIPRRPFAVLFDSLLDLLNPKLRRNRHSHPHRGTVRFYYASRFTPDSSIQHLRIFRDSTFSEQVRYTLRNISTFPGCRRLLHHPRRLTPVQSLRFSLFIHQLTFASLEALPDLQRCLPWRFHLSIMTARLRNRKASLPYPRSQMACLHSKSRR